MERIYKDENIIITKYDLVPFIEKLPKGAVVIGETNIALIERNCILVNEDEILKDGLLRIEYKKKAKGFKLGYLQVGYDEYIVLKSFDRWIVWIVYFLIFLLVLIDYMILRGYYL